MGVGGQCHTPATLPPVKDPVLTVLEAGGAPGPVWTGAENLASTRIQSPDHPARSESLYQLSYPGLPFILHNFKISFLKRFCILNVYCLKLTVVGKVLLLHPQSDV